MDTKLLELLAETFTDYYVEKHGGISEAYDALKGAKREAFDAGNTLLDPYGGEVDELELIAGSFASELARVLKNEAKNLKIEI